MMCGWIFTQFFFSKSTSQHLCVWRTTLFSFLWCSSTKSLRRGRRAVTERGFFLFVCFCLNCYVNASAVTDWPFFPIGITFWSKLQWRLFSITDHFFRPQILRVLNLSSKANFTTKCRTSWNLLYCRVFTLKTVF